MSNLIAGCFQFNVQPGEVSANLASVERAIPALSQQGLRLVVLPEMWSSGFAYPSFKTLAVETPGVLEHLKRLALRYRMVIVGSLPELQGETVYNSSYVVDANGEIAGIYRKIHLFSLHNEHIHFGYGLNPLVCDTEVGRLGIMICYDLRFPELSRKLALEGAEIICVSAHWPHPRIEHWSLLLRSRAVENQLFIIGCNGCGTDGNYQYGGASAVVSPLGVVLARAGEEAGPVSAAISREEMATFRRQIPCFSDRRPQIYRLDR